MDMNYLKTHYCHGHDIVDEGTEKKPLHCDALDEPAPEHELPEDALAMYLADEAVAIYTAAGMEMADAGKGTNPVLEAAALDIVEEGHEILGPTHAPVLGQPPGNVLPKGPLTTLTELAELVSVGLAELRRRPASVP